MSIAKPSLLNILVAVSIALVLCSCGGGPPPPKPGTPAFDFKAALEAHKTGDFLKACDLLVQVSKGASEFAPKAQPSAMLLSYASAKAYMELAEQYDEGGKKSRTGAAFRTRVNEYRAKTNSAAMQFIEASASFTNANKDGSVKDKEVVLYLDPGKASLEDPPQYQKLSTGIMVPEAEVLGAERHVIRHELLLAYANALNTPKEPRKAEAVFQNGEAKIPGAAFLLSVGKNLMDVGDMFGPKKLNQPHRILAIIYDEALEALTMVKDTKEAKDLIKKATDIRKKLNP